MTIPPAVLRLCVGAALAASVALAAKDELVAAETEETIELAVRKVGALCNH